ncbi:MAG: hypothetical protein WAX07_09755 [Candidatus Altiarchaeia archaeon]
MQENKTEQQTKKISIIFALFSLLYAGSAYAAGPADQCTHVLTMLPNMPSYNIDFNKGYRIDSGKYLICSGTKMSAVDISEFNFLCSDTTIFSRLPILIGWTYNSDTRERKGISGNSATVSSVERWDVMGAGSKTIGTLLEDHPSKDNFDIYTFDSPGNYIVYIDMIHAYCDNPAYYACPWLGGSWRSTICNYSVVDTIQESGGWVPIQSYELKVVNNPSIDVKNKPSITVSRGKQLLLPWKITNNGSVKVNVRITSDCNGWACKFFGYSGGTIELYPGDTYCLNLNVSVSSGAGIKNNVGVKITYDDAYGLSCFPRQMVDSYTEVTSSEKALTYAYTVTDDNSDIMDCKLWTDLSGGWREYNTQAVVNGTVAYLDIPVIEKGSYRWNVNCTDKSGKSAWAEKTLRTMIS